MYKKPSWDAGSRRELRRGSPGTCDVTCPEIGRAEPAIVVRVEHFCEAAPLKAAAEKGEEPVEGGHGKVLEREQKASFRVLPSPRQEEFGLIPKLFQRGLFTFVKWRVWLLREVMPEADHEVSAREECCQVIEVRGRESLAEKFLGPELRDLLAAVFEVERTA